jgi:hypothetical protein
MYKAMFAHPKPSYKAGELSDAEIQVVQEMVDRSSEKLLNDGES